MRDTTELLRLAQCVDDEADLAGVAAALREMARSIEMFPMDRSHVDALNAALRHTRQAGEGEPCCHGRHLCSYHEGWLDALDRLEDQLS